MPRLSRTIRSLVQGAYLLRTFISNVVWFLQLCLRSRVALAAENLFLRQQLTLYQERHIKPKHATNATRIAMVWLAPWFDWQPALAVVHPETFTRWQRQGYHLFWHGTPCPGRPPIPVELQRLIRQMACENVTWGQRRIAQELQLKLGLRVSPRTVRKYLPKGLTPGSGRCTTSQRWHTFLRNHAWDLIVHGVAADFTRGRRAFFARIIPIVQGWWNRSVAGWWRRIPPRDTTWLSSRSVPASGLAVWSPVIVEAIHVDQRSPPAGSPSSAHDPGFAMRATWVDRFDGCPAGAVRRWRNRASPRARNARLLCKGGSRVTPWRRAV
jgi:Homeodomain-like domain